VEGNIGFFCELTKNQTNTKSNSKLIASSGCDEFPLIAATINEEPSKINNIEGVVISTLGHSIHKMRRYGLEFNRDGHNNYDYSESSGIIYFPFTH